MPRLNAAGLKVREQIIAREIERLGVKEGTDLVTRMFGDPDVSGVFNALAQYIADHPVPGTFGTPEDPAWERKMGRG